jgi:hypothetical protein
MRCIGVTTTLSEADMRGEAPDTIMPDISHVSVADIRALAYTVAL